MSRRTNHYYQVLEHYESSLVSFLSITIFDLSYLNDLWNFRGSSDATKQAHTLIAALIKDPDVDILQMLPKSKLAVVTTSTWDKTVSTIAVRLNDVFHLHARVTSTLT